MKHLLLIFLPFYIYSSIPWETVVDDIFQNPEKYSLEVEPLGATNNNYHFFYEKNHYFMRQSVSNQLYADIEVEYQVLNALSNESISPKPLFFDAEKKILVMEYIEKQSKTIDLLDPKVRKEIIQLLHQVENIQAPISRVFHSYEEVKKLIKILEDYNAPLAKTYEEELLPTLKKIDAVLSKYPHHILCHLDLHHNNILQDEHRLWIIDWEYAALGDPFLTLASIASIEKWNNKQMLELLYDYDPLATEKEFSRLYLCRITADAFWAVWCRLQCHLSTLDIPYSEWEKLYFDAAMERIKSCYLKKALEVN